MTKKEKTNKVLFFITIIGVAILSFILHSFGDLILLFMLIAAVITMIVTFIIKIINVCKKKKYYDFNKSLWIWCAISEGYVLGFLIRIILTTILLHNGVIEYTP